MKKIHYILIIVIATIGFFQFKIQKNEQFRDCIESYVFQKYGTKRPTRAMFNDALNNSGC